jgi:hypothetical protein
VTFSSLPGTESGDTSKKRRQSMTQLLGMPDSTLCGSGLGVGWNPPAPVKSKRRSSVAGTSAVGTTALKTRL